MQFHICNLPYCYKQHKHFFVVLQAGLLWIASYRDAEQEKNNFPSLPAVPTCFICISSIPAGMHPGNSGISDPELNCCSADQETWQVLGEAELLSKWSNFTDYEL